MSDRTEVFPRPDADPGGQDDASSTVRRRDGSPEPADETRRLPKDEGPAPDRSVPPGLEETQSVPLEETRPVGMGTATGGRTGAARAGNDRTETDEATAAVESPADEGPARSERSSSAPAGPEAPAGPAAPELAERAGRSPVGPPPERHGPLPLSLAATAALAGEYRWIEHALYVLLGRWAAEAPLPSVRVQLDAQGMRHAWHAELWAERLPVLSGSNAERLTVPSPSSAGLFRLLGASVPAALVPDVGTEAGPSMEPLDLGAGTLDRPGTLPRLAGLYRVVLPRLVVSYERHLAVTAEPTDGPIVRTLRLVLNDETEDWRTGERLVQRLVTRPHDVAVVTEYQRRLESALVGAGARTGLVRIPGADAER